MFLCVCVCVCVCVIEDSMYNTSCIIKINCVSVKLFVGVDGRGHDLG